MKKDIQEHVSESWYHQKWFRVVLIIVGIDMILLGSVFILDLRIIGVIASVYPLFRVAVGFGYILTALFIIYHSLSYEKFHEEMHEISNKVSGEKLEKTTDA